MSKYTLKENKERNREKEIERGRETEREKLRGGWVRADRERK